MATRTNKQTNRKKGRINLHLCRPFLTHTPIITSTKGWRGIIDRFTSHLRPPMWLPHVQYLLPRNAFLKKGSQTQGRGNLFETGKKSPSSPPRLGHSFSRLSHPPIPSVSFYPIIFHPKRRSTTSHLYYVSSQARIFRIQR